MDRRAPRRRPARSAPLPPPEPTEEIETQEVGATRRKGRGHNVLPDLPPTAEARPAVIASGDRYILFLFIIHFLY